MLRFVFREAPVRSQQFIGCLEGFVKHYGNSKKYFPNELTVLHLKKKSNFLKTSHCIKRKGV